MLNLAALLPLAARIGSEAASFIGIAMQLVNRWGDLVSDELKLAMEKDLPVVKAAFSIVVELRKPTADEWALIDASALDAHTRVQQHAAPPAA